MMEVAIRAKGVGAEKQLAVKKNHGESYEFIMALHINDLVTMKDSEAIKYYRVQKLSPSLNKIMFRETQCRHTRKTPNKKNIYTLMDSLLKEYELRNIKINSLGKVL